ncbi:hypothetical protein SO802_012447 [Lithocarpus litseifolius]|uniref:Putative plant transposon protein domain-containing protein n=1 Tax=Lithocarpus litseifolius TaxID=425828 RepID=A0AAW2D3I0_9ROSI
MTPTKKKTVAKKGDRRLKMDNSKFRSPQHFERYTQFYLKAPIIQERFLDLTDLKDTFIPGCFEGRGWENLLSDFPRVCEPLIREFYANAVLRENEINCWVRGHEFLLDVDDIDEVLGFEGIIDHDFTNFKDRMMSIEIAQSHIGGVREGKCLNTIAFPADMRCLTMIMMFNLYPVRKLTTINNARAIFLMELKKKTFIDITTHIYHTIVDETRITSRAKLIFPSLLMRIFRLKGVEIPQDIGIMSTPSAINNLTISRIQVRLPSDEEGGDQEGGEGMETETEAAGHPSSSRGHCKRSRASSSSEVPPDAFQIILERIDGLRDIQNEQSDKLSAL